MTIANGLRLLLAARKSRKGTGDATDYERQDYRAKAWAESRGHAIVSTPADTVSSQTQPWKRKNLKPWMTDPSKLGMYDAILVSDTDRLSRGTDEDFHYIEDWCYRNGKRIIVADGPQFPPREGPMGDSDRYQWIAQKRAARTYWESVRDKHADTRELIKANGGAIGRAPFGYRIEGVKLRKTFVIDSVTGPLAREAFQRIADGRTATSVAVWLTEKTGQNWRVKRVIDMIKRRTYLGERDGHEFEALVTEELWESANSAQAARGFATGGRRAVHGYSSVVFCECGAQLYRHQSTKDGKEIGIAKYRCSRGRSGIASEGKCGNPGIGFDDANRAVDALMADDCTWEWVMVTTGGDHGRQMELQRIQAEMNAAMALKDMALLTTLAAKFAEVDAQPAEPVRTMPKKTGRTVAEAWASGSLADQRAMLGNHTVTVFTDTHGTVRARIED
jgi:DNA invertase Pin-like site-specific DNA recombinase